MENTFPKECAFAVVTLQALARVSPAPFVPLHPEEKTLFKIQKQQQKKKVFKSVILPYLVLSDLICDMFYKETGKGRFNNQVR